jgi:hypothetical protein
MFQKAQVEYPMANGSSPEDMGFVLIDSTTTKNIKI